MGIYNQIVERHRHLLQLADNMVERKTILLYLTIAILILAIWTGTTSAGLDCGNITPSERLNCGFGGITEKDCKKKGCCWDNSIRGVKWCFHPKDCTDCAYVCQSTTTK